MFAIDMTAYMENTQNTQNTQDLQKKSNSNVSSVQSNSENIPITLQLCPSDKVLREKQNFMCYLVDAFDGVNTYKKLITPDGFVPILLGHCYNFWFQRYYSPFEEYNQVSNQDKSLKIRLLNDANLVRMVIDSNYLIEQYNFFRKNNGLELIYQPFPVYISCLTNSHKIEMEKKYFGMFVSNIVGVEYGVISNPWCLTSLKIRFVPANSYFRIIENAGDEYVEYFNEREYFIG